MQRHTVEHIVDSAPVVPPLDAPVPLMAEQLADVLSLIAKYEKEMDRIEDLILVGYPCQHCQQGGLAALGQRVLLFIRCNEEEEEEEEEEATENGSSGSPTSSRRSCCRKL